jgi:hypothetical protein
MTSRYYTVPGAARRCGVDLDEISSLIKTQRVTAFVVLPGLLVYAPRELQRPGEPTMFITVAGTYALEPVNGVALAAGIPTVIERVWNYGDFTDGDYRNHGPVLLKDAYSPSPADLHVNIRQVPK